MKKRLKVINLFGAPGMGKSGVRAGVFFLMKSLHMSVEEVSEYAKHLVLTGRTWQLAEEQGFLLAKQLHAQNVLARNGYEYAITDSPLQLCSFYAPESYYPSFSGMVDEAHEDFQNINFFLHRDVCEPTTAFEERGRAHDRAAAMRVDFEMREHLAQRGVPFVSLPVDIFTPWRILEHICPGAAPLPVFPAPAK